MGNKIVVLKWLVPARIRASSAEMDGTTHRDAKHDLLRHTKVSQQLRVPNSRELEKVRRRDGASSDDHLLLCVEASHLAVGHAALDADCARHRARMIKEQTACDRSALEAEAGVAGLVSEGWLKIGGSRRAALSVSSCPQTVARTVDQSEDADRKEHAGSNGARISAHREHADELRSAKTPSAQLVEGFEQQRGYHAASSGRRSSASASTPPAGLHCSRQSRRSPPQRLLE